MIFSLFSAIPLISPFEYGHFTLAQTIESSKIGEVKLWMKACQIQVLDSQNLQVLALISAML